MKLYIIVRIVFLLPLFFVRVCDGQALSIGDRCPDVVVSDHSSEPVKFFQLSDLKAKLIILDFWGTGCTSCVKAFPKIDSLQKRFGGEVQFILVNKESVDSTRKFFSKRKSIRKPGVPMMMGDVVLHELFPHFFVPHHVWLDSNRMVRYITDGYNATEKNIGDFLNGQRLDAGLKKDVYMDTDLFVRQIPDWKKNMVWYSALSHCVSGLAIGNAISSTIDGGDGNRISCNCMSISQLFQTSFSEGNKYDFDPPNTVILNVKDKWKFTYPETIDQWPGWINSHAYYYELLVPPAKAKNLYKIMQKDLMRYFDVDVRVEKRRIKCLLLIPTGSLEKLKSKGGNATTNFFRMSDDSIRYIRNLPFERLTGWLTRMPKAYRVETPLISVVKFTGNIDFEISNDVYNTEEFDLIKLRKTLLKYNLDLVEKSYVTDVLVISDKK